MSKNISILSLCIICFLATMNVGAQTTSNSNEEQLDELDNPRFELSINALYLLLGGFEIRYEHLLSESSSVGALGYYRYDSDFWELKSELSGYYRHYFSRNYASGFYGEAFVSYNTMDEYYWANRDELSHNFGVGFSFGYKLISKENLLLDLGLGLGRNIISSKYDDWFFPRINISFGYRF